MKLTPRQREELIFLAQGLSEKEIARHLNISRETVKIHVRQACLAVIARNRTHAVAIALRKGLIL